MTEVLINDKIKYLKLKYPFSNIPLLTDKRYCMHCENEFTVGDYKVMKDAEGREYICCPNAPECDGTVIDWVREVSIIK
jgi:hypothetical protein